MPKDFLTYDPDIVALFEFDARLHSLFMEAIARVERKLRSSVSYAFCSREGCLQERYLDPASYSDSKKHCGDVARLVKIMERIAVHSTEHPYISHYRDKHGNVPLWATLSAMTFGQTSKMYVCLKHPIQSGVAKQYEHVNERELGQHLKVLVLYRNCCAHGERLFSHKVHSDVPDTPLHAKLGIFRSGGQYAMGKRDLFGAVLSLRYLLPPTSSCRSNGNSRGLSGSLREAARQSRPASYSVSWTSHRTGQP